MVASAHEAGPGSTAEVRGQASRRRWVRHWLPPQHGAWAMLLLPFGIGVLRGGPGWIHLPLLVAWVGGYLAAYYAQLAIKTRSPSRVRPQLLVYGPVTVLAAVTVLLLSPSLALAGPVFAPLLAVNAWYAWRRRERALPNGIASALQGSLMALVAVAAVGEPVGRALGDAMALMLYFGGSLLYVKTMIRERGDSGYLQTSVAYHLVALGVAVVMSAALLVPFGWFLARAIVLPRRPVSVTQVGLLELAGSLLLAAVLVVAR